MTLSKLALGVISTKNLWLHVEFLSVIQALEGFHRGRFSGSYMGASEYESVRATITSAIIGLWAYPMSSWFWHKRIGHFPVSEWLFLDSPSQPIILPQQVQIKPILALVIGLVGGLVGYLFVFIFVSLVGNIIEFIFALSVCIQALVAGFVTVWMRHLGSIHGLFSASIAACVISTSVFTHTNLSLADALFLVTKVFNSGELVAIPTVLIVSGIISRFRDSKKFRVKV